MSDRWKKFVCEFWAAPNVLPFTPGATEVAQRIGITYPERQLKVEVAETRTKQDAETWARAIAEERGWRYVQTTEVTEEFMAEIRQSAIAQDVRAIRVCLALEERPWLQKS